MTLNRIGFSNFNGDDFLKEGSELLDFPEICLSCGKSFSSPTEFMSQTVLLPRETYFDKVKGEVVDHRKCECGETLIARKYDQRAKNKEAKMTRIEFQKQLVFLVRNGIPMERARDILMEKRKF